MSGKGIIYNKPYQVPFEYTKTFHDGDNEEKIFNVPYP